MIVQAITISVSRFNLAFVISPPIPLFVVKTSAITMSLTAVPREIISAVSNAGYNEGKIIYFHIENLLKLKIFPTSNNLLSIFFIALIKETNIMQNTEIETINIAGFPFKPNHKIANISQLIGGITCKKSTIGKIISFKKIEYFTRTVRKIAAIIPKESPNKRRLIVLNISFIKFLSVKINFIAFPI